MLNHNSHFPFIIDSHWGEKKTLAHTLFPTNNCWGFYPSSQHIYICKFFLGVSWGAGRDLHRPPPLLRGQQERRRKRKEAECWRTFLNNPERQEWEAKSIAHWKRLYNMVYPPLTAREVHFIDTQKLHHLSIKYGIIGQNIWQNHFGNVYCPCTCQMLNKRLRNTFKSFSTCPLGLGAESGLSKFGKMYP